MRVAERTRQVERSANTLERRVALIAPRVQHALKTGDQRLVGKLLQSRRQPFLGQIQVAAHERRLWVEEEPRTSLQVFPESMLRLPPLRA